MFLNLLGTTRPSYRGKQKRGGSVKLLWRPEPGRRRGNACLWMETNRLRLDYHRLRGFLSLKSLTGLSLSDTYTPSLLRATHTHTHTCPFVEETALHLHKYTHYYTRSYSRAYPRFRHIHRKQYLSLSNKLVT